MKCTHPLYAIDLGFNSETGNRLIKIAPKRADFSSFQALEEKYGKGNIIPLPCGKCVACRINYVRSWSVRCLLEASLYEYNYFVTLTIDNDHYDDKLKKSDISSFMKRLRNVIPGVRFFASGERGSNTNRCHYHILLFNCPIPDLRYVYKYKGHLYYDSEIIKNAWKKGFITITDVNMCTCDYVSNYVIKKYRDPKKTDEFLHMSNRPGIGYGYLVNHLKDIYETDGVYVKGDKYKVPRYFDKVLCKLDPVIWVYVKEKRLKDVDFSRLDELLRRGVTYDEEVYSFNEEANYSRIRDRLEKGVL